MAATCIPLASSTTCPAFNLSSVDTTVLPGQFPFLSTVTSTQSFDTQLTNFVGSTYVQNKYINLFGCSNVDLSNTTDLYARYTYSFICNAIVQNSVSTCRLSGAQSMPLCADSCADFALSEQTIVSSPQLCGTNSNTVAQLRADFTNCALPANSLTSTCIEGYENEGSNCGFESNISGLCSYCSGSSQNSTDSCCVTAQVEARCQDVTLPTYTSMQPLFTTGTAGPKSTGGASGTRGGSGSGGASGSDMGASSGLTGGQIAGIVIGAVLGALLLLGLLICCCVYMRRRRDNRSGRSSLNQPTPPRSGVGMTQTGRPPPFEALPGARVTRMTALEGGFNDGSPEQPSGFNTSPESQHNNTGVAAAMVPTRKKTPDALESSPESAEYSSPEGTGQSERMSFFKDYYSQDDIHAGDLVSVLWAYQPRAADEFELERGDMLKIVGIWDDGWATAVMVNMRADDWSPSRGSGRDSVVSSEGNRGASADSDVKAFPLVCVCLPQHWKRTIEGEPPSSPPPSD